MSSRKKCSEDRKREEDEQRLKNGVRNWRVEIDIFIRLFLYSVELFLQLPFEERATHTH